MLLVGLLACTPTARAPGRAGDAGCAALTAWYLDVDGDGWGRLDDAVFACEAPDGRVPAGGDCDDASVAAYPGAPEGCDATEDLNCDGTVLSSDGVHLASTALETWWKGAGSMNLGSAVVVTTGADGAAVVWMGAPAEPTRGMVYRGPLDQALGDSSASTLADRWVGAEDGEQLGEVLSAAGDVDRDGIEDVVAGAPALGRVHLLSGVAEGTNAVSASTVPAPADAVRFGQDVEVGDLDDDGRPDLVVGAPWSNRVYVYPGWDGGAATEVVPWEFTRRYANGELGGRIAPPTDLDGDGLADLLVADPYAALDADHFGAAFVVEGPVDGPRVLPDDAALVVGDDTDRAGVGSTVAILGDADGDGLSDWLVGLVEGAAGFGGAVVVRGGAAGTEDVSDAWFRVDAASEADGLGQSLLGGVDLDADGRADPVLGGTWGQGTVAGFACWAPGRYTPADALFTVGGATYWDAWGWALAADAAEAPGARRFVVGAPGVADGDGEVRLVDLDVLLALGE